MAIQRVLEGTGEPLRPEPGAGVLEVSALFESTTHVSGIGWRLTTADGAGPIRTATRRYGRTLIFSELAALRGGLLEAARQACCRVRIRAPTSVIASLFEGSAGPRYRRAAASARRMGPLLGRFDEVRFDPPAPPDPELEHAVGEALDLGLHRVAEEAEHREHVIEQIIERSAQVLLERRQGGWIANGRYRVSLDPFRCDCPAWTARWARVPIAGRRAARLPCKHLVAAAVREGVTIPADLAELGRKASS